MFVALRCKSGNTNKYKKKMNYCNSTNFEDITTKQNYPKSILTKKEKTLVFSFETFKNYAVRRGIEPLLPG